MEELTVEKTREMWNRYWRMKNKYNNTDDEGNPVGKGVMPSNDEDKVIYNLCNQKMREEKFKNWRAIINEENNQPK